MAMRLEEVLKGQEGEMKGEGRSAAGDKAGRWR